jgi:MFS family permease
MSLFRLFLGIVMLTMGRRLYWLVLGGVGFILGFEVAKRMLDGQPHGVILLIAVLGGVIGALFAVFLQKFAIAAGGFLAGGYLLILLLRQVGMITVHYQWLIFLIGGIAGALLMTILFGWTLIVISSAIGAILILPTLHAGPRAINLLFLLLLALGIAIQYGLFKWKPVKHSKTPLPRTDRKPW